MPKMIVSIDGVVIKEVALTKDRTTLGRRPYNDIVIDNLAVSGEHAVLLLAGSEVHIEDLNSTNGTYVNGKPVKRQLLQNSDSVEIGKYRIRYLQDGEEQNFERTMVVKPSMPLSAAGGSRPAPLGGSSGAGQTFPRTNTTPLGVEPAPLLEGVIRVLSGAAAGREVALTKVVTTVGKPGVAVAAITKRPQGFLLAHVEGMHMPTLNGNPIGNEPVMLRNGDYLELAGTRMQFEQT